MLSGQWFKHPLAYVAMNFCYHRVLFILAAVPGFSKLQRLLINFTTIVDQDKTAVTTEMTMSKITRRLSTSPLL